MISSDTFSLTDAEQIRFAYVQKLGEDGEKSVLELLDMLTDSSWVVRRSVVETLARVGDLSVGLLIQLLEAKRDSEARIAAVVDTLSASTGQVEKALWPLADHKDPAIVADVAQILGRRRSSASVPILIRLTRAKNDNVAVCAIEALGRIGGRAAVEALIEIVKGKNFFRIFPTIDVLGRSGDPRVVEPLKNLLTDPTYLPEASRALGRSGERSAVAPLVELMRSPTDAILRVAAPALWDLRERFQEKSGGDVVEIDSLIRKPFKTEMVLRLGRVLPQSDVTEAVAICKLLGIIGNTEAVPSLTFALESESPVAAAAADALKKVGGDADAPLIKAIQEGNSERRRNLLPLFSRSSAAAELVDCLRDSNPEIRSLACDTMARLGNPKVIQKIFTLLEDENPRVVHSATAAIQALGSRETRDLAVQAASSENPIVRRSALRILSYFGDSSTLQTILDGLNDADARVQEAAIHGLPFFEETAALEALLQTSQNLSARTRALAMRSLGQLSTGSERIYSVLISGLKDSDPWTRYYSCQSLGRLKYIPASTEVAKLLDDSAGQVRVAAVEALSHFDSPVAHKVLRSAAEREDLEVRRAALVGLGITGRTEYLTVLMSAATSEDSSTRLMALSAISKFASMDVLNVLKTAASDRDEQVSTSAISFLGLRPEREATELLIDFLNIPKLFDKVIAALLVPSEGRIAGLLIALESADHETAATLVSILSRLQRPDTRPAILAAMKLNNVAARIALAPILAARRDYEMTSALQEAAENDPDQEVRTISSLLLQQ